MARDIYHSPKARSFLAGLFTRTFALGVTAGLIASCGPTDRLIITPVPQQLAVAERANEHVSMAATGDVVVAAWAATDQAGVTDIYAAVSRDAGASFAAPLRVNATAGDARANGEQPPRVALVQRTSGDPDIVVLWTARRASGTVLLTAGSQDGGVTFDESRLVAGTDTTGNRGWHAIDADGTGAVHAVWLDHRRMAAPAAGTAPHQHQGTTASGPAAFDGVAMAQQSDLYFETLGDGAAPRALAAGVCYCCKTAVAHGADHAVYLAWRHVYAGNMRDIAFTASRDAGRTFAPPVRISEDGWSIAGCPDDGPAMTVDGRGRVHIVWPTMVTRDGKATKGLFHAMTQDGRSFTPRVRIPSEGTAHHPQVTTAPDGSLIAVWDETAGADRRVASARGKIDASGSVVFQRGTFAGDPGRYPVLVATQTHVLAAWVSGQGVRSVIHVEQLP